MFPPAVPTLNLIMVLKWLFLKKTQSSPSCTVDVSSHRPWYVSWVAVLFRNCSATMPGMREKSVRQVERKVVSFGLKWKYPKIDGRE